MESFQHQRHPIDTQCECERIAYTLQYFVLATTGTHLDSVLIDIVHLLETNGSIDELHVLTSNDKSVGNHSVEENLLRKIYFISDTKLVLVCRC